MGFFKKWFAKDFATLMYYLVLGIAIFSIVQIVNCNRKRKLIYNKAGDITLRNNIVKLSKIRSR